ncbi:MAG: biotin synthase BioB [Pseudomonadota bacterium]
MDIDLKDPKAPPAGGEIATDAFHGTASPVSDIRYDWTVDETGDLFALPLMDLLYRAQTVHRAYHDPNAVQLSQLISIKTGGCAEDCGYCSQSAKYAETTGTKATKLMDLETVLADAERAKAGGASRYCMGAAWSRPKDRDMDALIDMVRGVRELGLETCMTLGMLTTEQADRFADAGLDYYNHNVDTSEEFYGEIITTRRYEERIDTLNMVRDAGINVCSGGIIGMGESRRDRAGMLVTLATLEEHPESVPINLLMPIKGTPLGDRDIADPVEFVRTIAVARIMMPRATVRLSAGRELMSEELQALAFFAGAGSIFTGDKLLTAPNPGETSDKTMLERFGMHPV